MTDTPHFYSVAELATMLKLGKTKTWELVHSGAIESVRIGRRRLVPHDAYVGYCERLRADAAA